jgi:hypothetical protein
MRVLFCKFCEYVTQLGNGRQCLIGIFENVATDRFPFEHPPFYLAVQLEFDADEGNTEFQVRADLIDEDGKVHFRLLGQERVYQDPLGGPTKLVIVFVINSLVIEHPGMYRLDLWGNEKLLCEERLPIILGL